MKVDQAGIPNTGYLDELSASEALFGFMGWLTTRETPVTFSASHNAAEAADLIRDFCETNHLQEPRSDYIARLTHPTN